MKMVQRRIIEIKNLSNLNVEYKSKTSWIMLISDRGIM